MAGGKFASLQRLTPNQGDISTDLLNREDQQFKYRAEQRMIADKREAARAANKQKANEAHSKVKSFGLANTGSETLDGTYADAITGAAEEMHRLTDIFIDESGKYSQVERNQARIKFNNLEKIPENFKTMTDAVSAEKAEYDKLLSEGKIFRDEEYERKFQQGFKGITLGFDDSGMPVSLFKKGQTDVNGDGILDEFDVETMDSLNDAYSRPQFQGKYDYDAVVNKHAQNLESAIDQKVGNDGFSTIKTTGVGLNELNSTVKGALYSDGQPTALMKSFVREKGLDINNQADLDKIEEQYKNDILIRTKRGKEVDPNSSAKTSANRLAFEKQKEKNKEGEPIVPGSNISLNVDENGEPVLSGGKGGEGRRENNSLSFIVNNLNKKGEDKDPILIGEDYVTIKELFLGDNNEITYKGVISEQDPDTKEWKTKTETGGGLNKNQLGEVSVVLGLKDAEELRKQLEKTRDEKLGNSSSKKTSNKLSKLPD